MAPVEPDASARSNVGTYASFYGHALLVVILTCNVVDTAYCAAKALPPATRTRTQRPLRRNYAILFSTLAFFSIASVGTFSVIWRAIEYIRWAQAGKHDFPNSLWRGWYANDNVRWHVGDWAADVDLVKEWSLVSVATPEGFLYTSQQYVGLLASAIFMGVEGQRRNLDAGTIASFLLLSATGSLGFSLSLFFVTILYTPLTLHSDDASLSDALRTPFSFFYYVPILVSLFSMAFLPDFLAGNTDIRVLRFTITFAVPLFLAFAPQIIPASLGRRHTSKAAAHRSYSKVYHFLAVSSFLLYWRLFYTTIVSNEPTSNGHYWDVFTNSVGLTHEQSKTNAVLQGISTTGQRLKQVSKHPAISATSLDVLFTSFSLLAWAFTRNLDVEGILDNSILSFLVPKHEKHVAFEDDVKRLATLQSDPEPEPEVAVETTTPRKRGRPAKNKTAVNGASSSTIGSVRRGTRRSLRHADHESDGESMTDTTYQPSDTTKRAIDETEADGAITSELLEGGESTALALFLAIAGGLGQLASSTLGAEVTGPRE